MSLPSPVDRILAMMQTGLPRVAAFFTTTTSEGNPSTRQVSPLVSEDFSVELISGAGALKVRHLRRHPMAACLWVELRESRPARTVFVQGEAELVTDPAGVQAFLNRRAAATGQPAGAANGRVVIRLRPRFLRAEKFMGEDRSNPVVIRDFANPTAQPVSAE